MWEVESLLHRPRKLAEDIIKLQIRQLTKRSNCENVTVRYGGIGGGSGGGGAKDYAYADLADTTDELEALKRDFQRSRSELMGFLDAFEADYPRSSALLRCRYLWWFEWTAVKEWMSAHGYHATTLRTTYNWHNAALRDAKDYWEVMHDTSEDLHSAE